MEGAFELVDTYNKNVVIKVISVSESGDDAVRNLEKQIGGVDFVYFDAIENTNIREILNDANMVFLIGATNDSKLNDIAEIVSDLNILTIAVVTNFITLETSKNITQLLCHVDENRTTNDVLLESIKGITDSITAPRIIGMDFNDIKTVMACGKTALMSTGFAMGEHRIRDATLQAMNSPLFLNINLKTVRGISVTIATSDTSPMGIGELLEVNDLISKLVSEDATIKTGVFIASDLDDYIKVTITVCF